MANIKQPTEEQQKRWFAFAQNYNAAKQKQQQRQSFRSSDNHQGTETVTGLGRRFAQTPTAPSAVQPGSVQWEAPDQETALYQRNLNAFLSGNLNAPKVNTANSEYRMGSPASVAQYGDYLKQHAERGKDNALKYGEWYDKAVQPKADEAKRAFIQKNMDSLSPQEMAKAIDSGLQATDEQRVMAAQATGNQKYLGYGNEAWRKYTNEESMQRDYDYGHYLPSEDTKDNPYRDSYWGYTPEVLEGWKKSIQGDIDSLDHEGDSFYSYNPVGNEGGTYAKGPRYMESEDARSRLFASEDWYEEYQKDTGKEPDTDTWDTLNWFADNYGGFYDSEHGMYVYPTERVYTNQQAYDNAQNGRDRYQGYIDRIDAELENNREAQRYDWISVMTSKTPAVYPDEARQEVQEHLSDSWHGKAGDMTWLRDKKNEFKVLMYILSDEGDNPGDDLAINTGMSGEYNLLDDLNDKYDFKQMTGVERSAAVRLYNMFDNDEDREKAVVAFMHHLRLDERRAANVTGMTTNFTAEHPIVAEAGRAVVNNTVNPIMGVATTIGAVAGWQEARNPYNRLYDTARIQNAVVEQNTKNAVQLGNELGLPEWLSESIYQGVTSTIDNTIQTAIGSGVAAGLGYSPGNIFQNMLYRNPAMATEIGQKITTGVSLGLMAATVLDTSYPGNFEKSGTGDNRDIEARVRTILSAVNEVATEIVSPENLIHEPKTVIGGLAKAFVSEGLEEFNNDVLDALEDHVISTVYGHESEIGNEYNRLTIQKKMSPEDAALACALTFAQKAVKSFMGGAMGGLIGAGGHLASNAPNALMQRSNEIAQGRRLENEYRNRLSQDLTAMQGTVEAENARQMITDALQVAQKYGISNDAVQAVNDMLADEDVTMTGTEVASVYDRLAALIPADTKRGAANREHFATMKAQALEHMNQQQAFRAEAEARLKAQYAAELEQQKQALRDRRNERNVQEYEPSEQPDMQAINDSLRAEQQEADRVNRANERGERNVTDQELTEQPDMQAIRDGLTAEERERERQQRNDQRGERNVTDQEFVEQPKVNREMAETVGSNSRQESDGRITQHAEEHHGQQPSDGRIEQHAEEQKGQQPSSSRIEQHAEEKGSSQDSGSGITQHAEEKGGLQQSGSAVNQLAEENGSRQADNGGSRITQHAEEHGGTQESGSRETQRADVNSTNRVNVSGGTATREADTNRGRGGNNSRQGENRMKVSGKGSERTARTMAASRMMDVAKTIADPELERFVRDIGKALEDGKTISRRALGRFAIALDKATNKQARGAIISTIVPDLVERAKQLGEEAQKAQEVAEAVAGIVVGQDYSNEQLRSTVAQSKAGTQLIGEMTGYGPNGQELELPDNVRDWANSMMAKGREAVMAQLKAMRATVNDPGGASAAERSMNKATAQALMDTADMLLQEGIISEEADPETTNDRSVTIIDPTALADNVRGIVKGITDGLRVWVEKAGSGRVLTQEQYQALDEEEQKQFEQENQHGVTVDVDGTERVVPLAWLNDFKSQPLAMMLHYNQTAAQSGANIITSQMFDGMLNQFKGGNLAEFMIDFVRNFREGFMAESENTEASEAWKSGRAAAVAAEKQRLNRQSTGAAKALKSGLTIDEHSEEAVKKALNASDLRGNALKAIEALAERLNIRVVLFEGQHDSEGRYTGYDGKFVGSNEVWVDINAGMKRVGDSITGNEYAVLRVLSHELTHFIEANNAKGYGDLRRLVMDALKQKGIDFNAGVAKLQQEYMSAGEILSWDGAVAEYLARSCETMLKDTSFINNVQKTSPGLAESVKKWIDDFSQKVKDAWQSLTGGRVNRYNRALLDEQMNYIGGIQEAWGKALGVAVANVKGENVTDSQGLEMISEDVPSSDVQYLDDVQHSLRVTDKDLLDKLNNTEYITTYRAMQLIDGKLYPPMAEFTGSKKEMNRGDASTFGVWEMAEERPDLAKQKNGKWYFTLKKMMEDGSVNTVDAAYNPYMHSSNTMLNDQFSTAYKRPNLVVVESRVPVTESDGAYHAEKAHDATGWREWKSGIVATGVSEQKPDFRRNVFLSRYIMPVRIVPVSEVAQTIKGYLEGTDVTIPFQCAWPELRDALIEAGLPITEPRGLGGNIKAVTDAAYHEWLNSNKENDTQQNNAENAEEIDKFSFRDGVERNIDDLTVDDVREWLKLCKKNTAANDKSADWTYIPYRKSTPAFIRYSHNDADAPMIMNVGKARQALAAQNISFGRSHGHGFSIDDMLYVADELDRPYACYYSESYDRYAAVIEMPDGRAASVFIDPAASRSKDALNGYRSGVYSTVVTVFSRFDVDDALDYIEHSSQQYKEIPHLSEVASTTFVPQRTDGVEPADTIPSKQETVNTESISMWERGEIQKTAKRSTADAQMKDFRKLMDLQGIEAADHTGEESQYSVRTYDGDITVREFMRSMDTSELTVQEKKAYAAYTAQYDKVQDISSKLIEQQNLAAVSVSQDERVAAQNRADILQKQLMRESQTLYKMESSKGAAWMLRDARMLEEYLWSSESTDVNMMISDLNAKLQKADPQLKRRYRILISNLKSNYGKRIMAERRAAVDSRKAMREAYKARSVAAAQFRMAARAARGLHKLAMSTDNYKHVPEHLRFVVDSAMQMIANNDSSGFRLLFDKRRAFEYADRYGRMAAKDNGPDAVQTTDSEHPFVAMMNQLRDCYQALNELRDAFGRGEVSRLDVYKRQAVLGEAMKEAMRGMVKTVKQENSVFMEGRTVELNEIGEAAMGSLEAMPDRQELAGKLGQAVRAFDGFIRSGNLTPIYFFRGLGNETFTRLYDNIRMGQHRYGLELNRAKETLQGIRSEYKYSDKWADERSLALTLESGDTAKLTVDEALTLWASWKREHSNPDLLSEHLEKGGFRLTAEIAEKGRNVNNALKIFTMTAEDFKTLDGLLTTGQKGYADALVKYMSTDLSAMGNEVTMRLFDSKLFKDDYYIPFKTDPNSRPRQQDAGSVTVDEVAKITHPGFAKARLAGSNNALTINGITEVTAAHTQQMLNYVTMAEPVQDLNKVLNWKRPPVVGEDGERLEVQPLSPRVRTMFMTKYGSTAEKYLAGFQKDLAGGAGQDMQAAYAGKLTSMFKRGAVFGNMSVVAKQPLSYIRAAAVIDPKYLVKGVVPGNGNYDELMKYSGVAVIKQMGAFDMGYGHGGAEYLLDDDANAWAKFKRGVAGRDAGLVGDALDQAVGNLPGRADAVTWSAMWRAVKAEQADGYEGDTSSEEFLQKCGERFNEVMDLTQVYDSVLTRSANMRSKDGLMKMLTAFRAEPTLTANMIYDAFAHGDARTKARATAVYIVSAAAVALVSSFFSGIRKKKDDGKTLHEEVASLYYSNFWQELLPVNLLPAVSDVYSILQGQDIERSDMTQISDLVNATMKLVAGKYENPWMAFEETAGLASQMAGFPLKNIMRDARGLGRLATLIKEQASGKRTTRENLLPYMRLDSIAEAKEFSGLWDKRKTEGYGNRYIDAYLKGDKEETANIRQYMVQVLGYGASDPNKSADTDITNMLKERCLNGEFKLDEAVKHMVGMGLKPDEEKAYEAVKKWYAKSEYGEDDDFVNSVYFPLYKAVETKGFSTSLPEFKEIVKYGKTEDEVKSAVTGYFKGQYKDGKATWKEFEKVYKAVNPKADANDLYWVKRECDALIAHKKDKDYKYTKYDSLRSSIESGNRANMKSAVTELTGHGVKAETVAGQITDHFKPILLDMKAKGKPIANLQSYILDCYEMLGYNRAKKLKDIQKWFEPKKEKK